MWTFDRFEAGALIGTSVLPVTDSDAERWMALFPRADGAPRPDRLPAGLAVALMMRGYMNILGDRPPGNVHAEQTLAWGEPIRPGGEVVVSLRCLAKDLRNGRRWVMFENRVTAASGLLHLQGRMRMLWAQ